MEETRKIRTSCEGSSAFSADTREVDRACAFPIPDKQR